MKNISYIEIKRQVKISADALSGCASFRHSPALPGFYTAPDLLQCLMRLKPLVELF